MAYDNPQTWPGIFASATGLIFFGTPFRGMEGMKQVRGGSLRILGPGDEFLQDLVDRFLQTRLIPNAARVACFYETKSSNVGAIVGWTARRVRQLLSVSTGPQH